MSHLVASSLGVTAVAWFMLGTQIMIVAKEICPAAENLPGRRRFTRGVE
jgi:hypothetical protein